MLAGGTLTKSAGTGTTTISVPLENDGTVSASAGTLRPQRGSTDPTQTQTGSFGSAAGGGELHLGGFGVFRLADGAALVGNVVIEGEVRVNVGAVDVGGTGNRLASGGELSGGGTCASSRSCSGRVGRWATTARRSSSPRGS